MLPGRTDCGGKAPPGSVEGATLTGSGWWAMLMVTVWLGKHPWVVEWVTNPGGGNPTTGY